MRRALAAWFNDRGLEKADQGDHAGAARMYKLAASIDSGWSVPNYNLGLQYKYQGKWLDSLRYNRRAAEISPNDDDSWWNFAIAATALHDWTEARRAWKRLGVDIPDGEGEWSGGTWTACVRLDPNGAAEVVWGERIDPARFVIFNVPLPESGRRFRDIVLHDGASSGSRTRDGLDFPVFDELELWRASSFSTFQVAIRSASPESENLLADVCNTRGLGIEDWSTLRWLCRECSSGDPGPHDCKASEPDQKRYAIAARDEQELRSVLDDWVAGNPGTNYGDIELLVAGA